MKSSPNSPGPPSTDSLSSQTIHDLRAPLTVIKAQAQMLERWVHRSGISDTERALERLAVINEMVACMVLELDALRRATSSPQSPGRQPTPEGGPL